MAGAIWNFLIELQVDIILLLEKFLGLHFKVSTDRMVSTDFFLVCSVSTIKHF